ncbi:SHOCT domain-containing protein [Haloarcula sp. CBA1130]|uniref:SHOCT domain-containing protein n=1 Tax=unclassified Haloarcula TaxID=2624677 RepID=UPI00124834F4|nr:MULTISPECIES: SHOCT domain-containing protein [unclassified Haloarcula]KAA9398737.1 SHOCT domain-containing protein [Haloarcula sp. CBA1129]KAA9403252.1 SHOCT domain-containing protein [Haloarcula sp. CBA1130]
MPSTTDRALSTPLKVLLYGLLGVVSLIVVLAAVRLVFGLFFGLVGLLFGIISLAATIGVLVAIGYAVYWLVSRAVGRDEQAATTDVTQATDAVGVTSTTETDPVERLSERYANGELTEAELERRLEQALDEPSVDGSEMGGVERDRELN